MSIVEDIEFAQLLTRGDEKAFSMLYDSLWEPLFGYVVRVLGDNDDAMDVVQDTFIAIWQQRVTISNVRAIKSYMYSIARHKALRHIRLNIEKRDFLVSLIEFFEDYQDGVEEHLIANELQHIINAEIANLPPKMREIFVLSREKNLSYKEIADHLNISDKTVKKQISNSLKILRFKLNNIDQSALVILLLINSMM